MASSIDAIIPPRRATSPVPQEEEERRGGELGLGPEPLLGPPPEV